MLQVTDVQDVVSRVAERVGPAVVGLERGSGVVIAPGRILTSPHVLRAQDLRVSLAGRVALARVILVDPGVGVALLAADTGDAPPVEWAMAPRGGGGETGSGPSEPAGPVAGGVVALGAPVVALADPGGRGLRVTLGHVAADPTAVRGPHGRRLQGAIEHTAPLPRGAAGGPLTDTEGRLVGLNASRLEGGFILALPADAAMRARLSGPPAHQERPRLGLAMARPRNRAAGLIVRAVQDASPAAVAGIVRGDLVVAVEGRPVHTVDDVLDAVELAEGALTLTIIRGGTERDAELHVLQ